MTNDEIKGIKAGDDLRLYDGTPVTIVFRVKAVRQSGKGSIEKTREHRFAVLVPEPFEGQKRETLVVESDEYIRAHGFATHGPMGNRIRGVEKWGATNPYQLPNTMFGGAPFKP